MSDDDAAPSLLEELDARQNDVLAQLDDLNTQIERLIVAFQAAGSEEAPAKAA